MLINKINNDQNDQTFNEFFIRMALHPERDQPPDADGQLLSQLYHLLRSGIKIQVITKK